MPKRPRSHVLEELSLIALRNLLPAEWTITEVRRDYGLDARVEIFTDGAATGLSFWAQLKGTDKTDLTKALAEPFEVSTLNYLAAQADPVLLVRLLAATGDLYGRWLHRRNVVLKDETQKTLTIRWDSDELLQGAGVPDALAEEVRRFRLFAHPPSGALSASLQLPEELAGMRGAVEMLLQSRAARAGGALAFGRPGPHDVVVTLSDGMLMVDMAVSSVRIDMPATDEPMELAETVLISAAVCLSTMGRADAAVALVVECPWAPVLMLDPMAERLAAAFAGASAWRAASDLLVVYESADVGPSFFAELLRLRLGAERLSADDAQHVGENLLRVARLREERQPVAAGAAYYNAGNFLFTIAHDYPAALQAFEHAARCQPDYLNREYYMVEKAAALFEVGRYEEAAAAYDEAATRGGALDLTARKADCLAYAGHLGQALRLLEDCIASVPDLAPQWRLKLLALRAVAGAVDDSVDLDATALEDAYALLRTDDDEQATLPELLRTLLLVTAFPPEEMPEPWAFLLLAAHEVDDADAFDTAVAAGWRRQHETFVSDVIELIAQLEQAPAGLVERFRMQVELCRETVTNGFTVRFVGEDGVREELQLLGE